jgi:hypothetical protein
VRVSESEGSTGVRCECRDCTGRCDSWAGVVSASLVRVFARGTVQAWLQPVDLPLPEMLKCKASGRPLDFLLQVRRATHTWACHGRAESESNTSHPTSEADV